jgi:hypothetical protein
VVLDVENPVVPVYTTTTPVTYATLLQLPAGAVMNLRVEAEDGAGNRSEGGPTMMVKVPDMLAPQFPSGASMELAGLSSEGASIIWTEAVDDVGVTHYRLYQDNVLIAEPTNNSTTIEQLDPGVRHEFYVEAVDAYGNRSTNGPRMDAVLEDTEAPTWPVGSALIVAGVAPDSMSLLWPAALDNLGVAQYEVWVDGQLELSTVSTSAIIDELSPNTVYSVEVRPVDLTGGSGVGLAALVTTSELEPPWWTSESEVVAYEIGESEATVQWTPHSEALLYRVRCGSLIMAEVEAPFTSATIVGLIPAETYSIWIQVVDVNGMSSLDGPVVQFTTLDLTAPYWAPDAVITVEQSSDTSATLYWPKAEDNVGVDEYVVSVDGTLTLLTDVTSATLEGLSPGSLIDVSIQARDKAGNISTDGPTNSFALQASIPDTETIFQGLAVTCGGCHTEPSSTGFFESLSAFQELLMVPPYIVPGAAEQSELLALLSGLGTGDYAQMPPTGLSYLAQEESGAVPISMDTLVAWITSLPN